jgi:hypothetical protein
MRYVANLNLLSISALVGLLGAFAQPGPAAAITATPAVLQATGTPSASLEKIYYYRGRHYSYRYHGRYYHHRRYHHGHWRYY